MKSSMMYLEPLCRGHYLTRQCLAFLKTPWLEQRLATSPDLRFAASTSHGTSFVQLDSAFAFSDADPSVRLRRAFHTSSLT